jgi:hypothetical protein
MSDSESVDSSVFSLPLSRNRGLDLEMDNDGSTVLSADRHMSDADDDHLGEEDNIENEVESQNEGGVGASRTAQVLLSVLGDSSDQDDSSEEAEDDESIECYEQPEENDEDEDDDEDFAAALVMTGLGRNTDGKRNGSSQKKLFKLFVTSCIMFLSPQTTMEHLHLMKFSTVMQRKRQLLLLIDVLICLESRLLELR